MFYSSRQVINRPDEAIDDYSTYTLNPRNLHWEFFTKEMLKLGTVLVLSPRLGLRDENTTSIPIRMDKAPISGQLQFVHEECAVVGDAGAGLTNVIGMRKGTALIELNSDLQQYHYYQNLAALMDDVSHDEVRTYSNHSSPGWQKNDLFIWDI